MHYGALGDVVALEFHQPGTAAWLCTKDKYNLPMFSDVLRNALLYEDSLTNS